MPWLGLALALGLLSFGMGTVLDQQRERLLEDVHDHAREDLSLIRSYVHESLQQGNYQVIDVLLQEWGTKQQAVDEISLTTANGLLLGYYHSPDNAVDTYRISEQIPYSYKGMATLVLVKDLDWITSELTHLRALLFTAVAGIGLVFSLIIWLAVRRHSEAMILSERTLELDQANDRLNKELDRRKQGEKALRNSEEKLKALINATTDDMVVLLDPSFRIEIINKRAAHGFGKAVEQMAGHSLDEFISPLMAKKMQEYAQKVISSGQSIRFEDHRAERWYDNNMCPVLNDEGNPKTVAIFARDITERKRIEQALAEAKETAELANTSKTRFLTAASHDLRQPLQAISSHTDLLAISNTTPALAKPIKQLGDATRAMQELLEGLLDVSKLDTGTIRPEIRTFSVSSLLSQLRAQYQSIAMEKGLSLKLMPCTAVVRSDPTLLRVILQNLISNAIKYTHQGKVIIGCRHRGELLRIEVWDSGIGIPEDKQEAVFEEFYQLGNPARDRSKGAGIGLAIVKRMTNLLNHPLYMHSVAGKGSSFSIEVPVADSCQKETMAAQPGTTSSENGATAANILIIEDDEIVLDSTCMLLEALGYKVIPASGAEIAMQLITTESHTPEIIISDYRLSGDCVGTELVSQLRTKAGILIPAIILTGDITVSDDKNYLPDNSLLLQKPARAEELIQAINQLLGHPVSSVE